MEFRCLFKKNWRNVWQYEIKCVPLHSHFRNHMLNANKKDALVAQLVEHLTLNQRVQGSNPCRRTIREVIARLPLFFCFTPHHLVVWSFSHLVV